MTERIADLEDEREEPHAKTRKKPRRVEKGRILNHEGHEDTKNEGRDIRLQTVEEKLKAER